ASLQSGLHIHVACPELWQEVCDQEWGYAYHLERWFHRLLLEHLPSVLTPDPELADFVYVPQCAMNLYLSWKQAAVQAAARDGVWLPIHGDGDRLHGAVQVQRGEPKITKFGFGGQALGKEPRREG
ncbi:unnamed protein product, partial [Symbiodinium microadriaticum]